MRLATTTALSATLAVAAAIASPSSEAQAARGAGSGGAGGASGSSANGRGLRHFEDITSDLPNEPITAIAVDLGDDEVLYAGLDGFVFLSDDGGESWRPVLSFPRATALDDTNGDVNDTAGDADGDGDTTSAGGGGLDGTGAGGAAGAGAGDDGDDGDDDESDDDDLPEGGIDVSELGEEGEEADADQDGVVDEEEAEAAGIELPDGDADTEGDDADADADADDIVAFAKTGAGVRAITALAPGVVLVATPRGLYRSVNRGASFERLTIPGGVAENDVRDAIVDPRRPSRMYVATAAGLLVSRDGGASFASAGGAVGNAPGIALAASAGTVLVGTERGLFRSTDGGETFLEVLLRGLPPFAGVATVAIEPTTESYYVGTSRGLYVGERGAALLERNDGVPQLLVQALATDPKRPRAVVVGTRNRGVIFARDAGLVVDEGAEQVPAGEVIALARPKKNSDDVLVATERGLFVSRPGSGVKISEGQLQKLRAEWAREPSLDDTGRRAVEYANLEIPELTSLGPRARWSWLLPRVRASAYVTVGQTIDIEDFVIRAGDEMPQGIDPDNDNTDLFGNVGAFIIQPSTGVRQSYFLTMWWDIDRAIFNQDELGISRRLPTYHRAQRRVLESVRVAWIARRRLMTELSMSKGRGTEGARAQVHQQLRIDELTAQLDAATGGAFSQRAPAETLE